MIVFLWILGQLLAFAGIYFSYKKKDVIKTLFLGEGIFYALYGICSGLLFWVEHYSIKRALVATTILLLLYGIAAFGVSRKKQIPWKNDGAIEVKKYIPLLLLLVVTFFLSGKQSGFHDMSQDSGIYPARALFYMNDQNDTVIHFPEANRLAMDVERQLYAQKIEEIHCLNPDWYYEEDYYAEFDESPSGVIYGLPTFASLLALWGKIFGLRNMLGIVRWLCMLSVAFLYIALINKRVSLLGRCCMTLIFAASPMLIWSGRQTLTEMMLVTMVALFLAFLTEEEEANFFLAAMPLTAFMYTHIAGFFLAPIWVILGFLLYVITRKKQYLVFLLLLIPGLVTAFFWEGDVAAFYFDEHFALLFNFLKNILSRHNVRYVVLGVGVLFEVLAGVLLLLALRKKKQIVAVEAKAYKGKLTSVCVWLSLLTVVACFGVAAYRSLREVGKIWVEEPITHFLTGLGFVILPLAMLGLFVHRKVEENKKEILVCSLFIPYFFLIFCIGLYDKIIYYYYYARYLIPLYPVIFLAAGLMVKKLKPYIVVPVSVGIIVVTLVMNPALLKYQDMTDLSYENLESICDTIETDYQTSGITKERSAIIVNDSGYEEKGLLILPLKAVTGLDIYFLYDKELQEYQLTELGMLYDRIYLVTAAYEGFYAPEQTTWELIKEIENEVRYYDVEDTNAFYIPKSPLCFPNKYLVMRARENE
ncbi:MAG: hypothetical protein MJ105_00730 [Lachnospiraceae bacterium]|nr:hypothetical protein [Lachnospiraceae bacterium]